jgi:outer membrane protein
MFSKKILHLSILSTLSVIAFPSAADANANASPLAPAHLNVSCSTSVAELGLSLSAAIELALCSHPDTRAAAARLNSAQASEGQARSSLSPQFSGAVTASGTRIEGQSSTETRQAQFRLSYVLFDFGRRQAGVEAARATSLATQMDSQATAQNVILTTADRYFALLGAQRTAESAKASLATATLSKKAAQARFDAGLAPRLEVLQAQSLLASSELAEVRSRSAITVATAALAQQVGFRTNSSLTLSPLDNPAAMPLPALESLMSEAKARRPEALAALNRLESARAQEKAALAQGKPTLSMNVTGARNQSRNGISGNQAGIGFTLDIPLFDGGLAKNQRRQAKAQTELAAAELDLRLQAVELSAVQAHAQLSSAQQAYRSAESFSQAAEQAEEQAEGRYRAGVGTLVDWLDAQAKLTSARQQRLSTLIDWHTAKLSLARAVGSLNLSSL